MMKLHPLQLTLGLLAAFSFALAAGCGGPAPENGGGIATTDTSGGDHEHGDHEHGDHDHGDHEHGDHEHGDHDHADHDHGDHDHGEQGKHDHAHGDHDHDFKSLGEATAEIETLAGEIDKHLAAGDVDAAHDPLHHIGAVLIATEQMVNKMDDSETKTELSAAVTSLLDDFTKVDEHLHGGETKEASDEQAIKQYEQLQASIKEAIATLKKE